MKKKLLHKLTINQFVILILFLFLTLGNEILDIPHHLFNDAPTLYSQRFGEIEIELVIFFIVMTIQIRLLRKLYKQIKLLEGFLPICANCKKIRNTEDRWTQIEDYISQNSLAQFSHSICPECARKLYPEIYGEKTATAKRKSH